MELPIYKLEISDNINDDVEVDFVALVNRPAIEKNFMAFAENSFSNYPDSVSNNAKKALEWADENGWGSCGTNVGKTRANQLANKEPISYDTVQRMYSYLSRHKVDLDSSKSYEDGCGKLMYDAWGGEEALSWSQRIINKQSFAIQSEEQQIASGPLMLADTPIYRNDNGKEYYVVFPKDTIRKIVLKFFKKGYQSNVNLMHDASQAVDGVTMFESWITDSNRGILPMQGFEDAPDGSWFGSFKVENQDVWNKIKSGEFKGFSVEGFFNYKKEAQPMSVEESLWNQIVDVLSQVK
jgi:hypothetical protein